MDRIARGHRADGRISSCDSPFCRQEQITSFFSPADLRIGGYFFVDAKEDANYIGNLRAGITHTGAKACLRVTMNHQWTLADGTVAQHSVEIPYEFSSLWYDNRNVDYSVYYMGEDLSGKADFAKQDFITGFDAEAFDTSAIVDGVSLKLLIQVDAVQVNRYPQLWNIDALPWK